MVIWVRLMQQLSFSVGPFLAALVGALESAVVVGGVSALTAGLVSQGIPKQSAIKYEEQITADKFVLVVHGTAEETDRAHTILSATSPVSIEKHEGVESQKA